MQLTGEAQGYEHGGTQKNEYAEDEVVEVSCPLCGSDKRRRIYTEYGSIGVSECQDCSLVYTSPRIHSPEESTGATRTLTTKSRASFSRGGLPTDPTHTT